MLQGALARDEVPERHRELLAASGVRSYRQLVNRPLWDVSQAADLSVSDMKQLVAKVSKRLAPRSQTAFDMFLENVNRPMTLRTGLPLIDAALCGGLHSGAMHEFAGSSGIGKTQLTMTLAVQCALEYPESSVLYMDTERGFSAKRLAQIARARLNARYTSDRRRSLDDRVNDILQRIFVHQIDSLSVLLNRFKDLDDTIPTHRVKLVIVDSVASLLVKAHDLTFAQREHHVQSIARQLKYIGDVHQVFVTVTNRATTVEDELRSFTKPLLGDTWAHCVTSRFILERQGSYRVISAIKCPSSGYVVQPFSLSEVGVEPAEEALAVNRGIDSDDDDFAIHDDVLRDLDLAGLPTMDPSATLRSTQQSELSDRSEDDEREADESRVPSAVVSSSTAMTSDDIVCESNEESGSESE